MKRFICLTLALFCLLTSCAEGNIPLSGIIDTEMTDEQGAPLTPDGTDSYIPEGEGGVTAEVTDIGFEHVEENLETTITVECTEGTPNAYKLEDGVLKFSVLRRIIAMMSVRQVLSWLIVKEMFCKQ